jgi:hypothetical protein
MATPCSIPPRYSVYDTIRIALNERRIYDAVVLYSQLQLHEQYEFMRNYPEIYTNFVRDSAVFVNGR